MRRRARLQTMHHWFRVPRSARHTVCLQAASGATHRGLDGGARHGTKAFEHAGSSHTAQPACCKQPPRPPCRNHPGPLSARTWKSDVLSQRQVATLAASQRAAGGRRSRWRSMRCAFLSVICFRGRQGGLVEDRCKLAQCTAHTADVLPVCRHCSRAGSTFGSLLQVAAHLRQHAAVPLAGQQLVAHQHLPHIAVARIYRVAGGKLGRVSAHARQRCMPVDSG